MQNIQNESCDRLSVKRPDPMVSPSRPLTNDERYHLIKASQRTQSDYPKVRLWYEYFRDSGQCNMMDIQYVISIAITAMIQDELESNEV
ncbi:hypothetical protein EVB61_032 [Rhizobium phage RHph_TM21B]|nr:hypothetical protein EVB61_032 [Rhizobium phage RHph_TM21B]